MENQTTELENTENTASAEKPNGKGAKICKALRIALDVVLYLFLAFSIFLLIVTIVSKRSGDGAVNVFGYEMRVVLSNSMEKSENSPDVSQYKIKDIKTKSMIFVKRVPQNEEAAKKWYSELKVGDVLTFRYVIGSSQETITHRLIAITPTENGYIFRLQGDNRSGETSVSTQTIYTSPADYPDPNEHFNFVLGKVVGNSTVLGYIVYSVQQPLGIALIVIVPCAIIIIWQAIRIISVIGEGRKQKAAAEIEKAREEAQREARERESQAQELEELKRKLAELEKGNQSGNGDGDHVE